MMCLLWRRALVFCLRISPSKLVHRGFHGDYRLGNMIFSSGQVAAVLDWELCTLGDPLADVGYLLNSWTQPGEHEEDLIPTAVGGF
ncbi:MAG: hypothetical protein Ct9H90mP27_6180 [Gammaproteobacteria bacterium]|nr:MAG: hypothetical protein Ct9H90mP27_6180 [Gammaproteobacteria bacterium]